MTTYKGSCQCGEVAFEVAAIEPDAVTCHCNECRKFSGGILIGAFVKLSDLRMIKDNSLRWFRDSDRARRGFCSTCGSSLFFDRDGTPRIAVAAGCFDEDIPAKTVTHMWVSEAGNYFEIKDNLPQLQKD